MLTYGAAAALYTSAAPRPRTADRRAGHPEEKGHTVAKDKTKTEKTKGESKAKGDDTFGKPSEAPAGGDSWSLTDHDEPKSGKGEGSLYIFTPLRKETTDVTRGKKTESVEVIIADVVLVNEKKPAKSEEHLDVWVFAKYVQGSLRGFIGERKVLGRLVKVDDAASATGYHWELEDADADDVAAAKAYLESVDPFAQKSGKADADEKPAKKDKDKDKKKAA